MYVEVKKFVISRKDDINDYCKKKTDYFIGIAKGSCNMLTKLMYFFETLHCIRSFISSIILLIGIILFFVWKFKSKKTSLLICCVIAIAIPSFVIAHGCYSAYLRPTSMKVKLSQQELMDFSEYIIENDRFLNTNCFLPNNRHHFKEEHTQFEYKDGQTVNYNYLMQNVTYQPNSSIYYWLYIYENEQDSQKDYERRTGDNKNITVSENFVDKEELGNLVYIKQENYSLFAEQHFMSTFFDLHRGEHNKVDLNIYILHKNYIIRFTESTERNTPKLYSIIKKQQLFDGNYTLTTLVELS